MEHNGPERRSNESMNGTTFHANIHKKTEPKVCNFKNVTRKNVQKQNESIIGSIKIINWPETNFHFIKKMKPINNPWWGTKGSSPKVDALNVWETKHFSTTVW